MDGLDSGLLSEAGQIMRTLTEAGYEAYLVGGFVRDHVLDRPVHDIDIATSAAPADVMRIFPRAVPTGLEHGTVTVVSGDWSFEVTTFRREGGYEDHRRPDYVEFVDSLYEDLSRRDFTMNAMAMDMSGSIIDPFGGQADLAAGVLRCVGEAARRFEEDALRMLRCIRFATNYSLEIDPEAWDAMIQQRRLLKHIAMERVRTELVKTIEGAEPDRGAELLTRSGLLNWTKVPLEWRPFSRADTGSSDERGFVIRGRLSEVSAAGRWAALFVSGGHSADDADKIMRQLTFSNDTRNRVLKVIRLYEYISARYVDPAVAVDINDALEVLFVEGSINFGRQAASDLLELLRILPAEGWVITAQEHARSWLDQIQVWTPADLKITGHDMMKLAANKGPWIGKLLQTLTVDIALGKLTNAKGELLLRAKQYVEEWDIH